MSKKNGNITTEKQKLLNKADSYYGELEEATHDLEESAEKFGKNLLVVASIGIGLAFGYKLLSGDDDENEDQNIMAKSYSKPSRFSAAIKTVSLPILLGIAKNVLLPDLNKIKKDKNEGNPGENL